MKGEQKELSIKTVPVEIRVLTVDGKRMTKSVFDQIISTRYPDVVEFNGGKWLSLVSVLGWVRGREDKHLLYHKDGVLFKSSWDRVFDSINKKLLSELSIEDDIDSVRTRILNTLFNNQMQVFISI